MTGCLSPEKSACNLPSDCNGKPHIMCVGEWTCANEKCVFECNESLENKSQATTEPPSIECDIPADCEGMPNIMCNGSWQCADHKCGFNCQTTEDDREKTKIVSFTQGPCSGAPTENRNQNKILAQKFFNASGAGVMHVTHILDYVCCANITVSLNESEEDGRRVISVYEKNVGEMCRCLCSYEINVTVSGVQKGFDYIVRVYGVEYEGEAGGLIVESSAQDAAGEGGFCGGIAGILCGVGLECKLDGDYPDAGGVCVKPAGLECTSDSDCVKAGCSGQVCTTKEKARGFVTTCELRPEYLCFGSTSCGCVNGKCSWRRNPEFESCWIQETSAKLPYST